MSGAASFAIRTNEWQETSMATANPSAEQSSRPPCRSCLGANAIECTRMSSRPHRWPIAANTRLQLAWVLDVERQEDRRLQRFRQRLHIPARLVVQVGDGQLGAQRVEGLRAPIGDRVLVGDADDERLASRRGSGLRGAQHAHPSCEQLARVARDHQLLVGRDHPGGGPALRRADARAARGVGLGVERDAEPGRAAGRRARGRRRRARRCRR